MRQGRLRGRAACAVRKSYLLRLLLLFEDSESDGDEVFPGSHVNVQQKRAARLIDGLVVWNFQFTESDRGGKASGIRFVRGISRGDRDARIEAALQYVVQVGQAAESGSSIGVDLPDEIELTFRLLKRIGAVLSDGVIAGKRRAGSLRHDDSGPDIVFVEFDHQSATASGGAVRIGDVESRIDEVN